MVICSLWCESKVFKQSLLFGPVVHFFFSFFFYDFFGLETQTDCRLLGKQADLVSAKTPPNTLLSFWFDKTFGRSFY